jgi:hypothetical protein
MSKSVEVAKELALAKLEYELAQADADTKKKRYEALRVQLADEMINDNLPKFEINCEALPKYSFRLETKERWSPNVTNKDKLYDLLKVEAPELFTINAATLSSFINNEVLTNDGVLPEKYNDLVKKYDDTHVVVRTLKR